MEDSVSLAQWAPGVSLGWALFSLAVGGLIASVIVYRLWRDHREAKQPPPAVEEEESISKDGDG